MTLLDAITRAEPDELYNLAATSFVPASWRQPVMTAQFTAVGVTSMLEAVRITKPDLRVYQASTSEMFGATTSPRSTSSRASCRTTPTRWPSSTATSWSRPTASATACTRARGSSTTTSRHAGHRSSSAARSRGPRRRSSSASPTELQLGDLEARRDWSFAGDVAEAMWLMLQQDAGDDYVVCSGVSRTVRELVRRRLRRGRPRPRARTSWSTPSSCARAIPCRSSATRPRRGTKLGWEPRTSFEDLIRMMVEHDLQELSAGRACRASDLAH